MDSLTDGTQSETFHIDLTQRYPETGGSIIGSLDGNIIFHMTDKKQVEGMDIHAGIVIDIGNGKEIGHIGTVDGKSCLLEDLPDHTLLGILVVVNETARQVECILGRFLTPTGHKQLTLVVQDKGCRRGSGVLIVGKTTIGTVPAQGIVDLEVGTTTLRTVMEYF